MNTKEYQTRLFRLGYDPGPADGIHGYKTDVAVRLFQTNNKLGVDGKVGPITAKALRDAEPTFEYQAAPSPSPVQGLGKLRSGIVPDDWMPDAKMRGIVVHWTAGPNKATGLDRSHYHIIIQGDGTLVRGDHSIKANERPAAGKYAAHTLNHNTGIIGVSLACMAGAVERPFSSGSAPMTRTQWDALPGVLAALCARYGIEITPRTVLSHAEVEGTLGIKQRGKWDIARLSFDPTVIGAKACGDIFRSRAKVLLP